MKRAPLVFLFLAAALVICAADRPIITVLDFKVDGVSDKEMKSLVSLLSSALFRTGVFKVIDTTQRDTLLKEVAFSTADCTDESCQLQIGKMLSAEMIVVGTVGKLGSRYVLSAKMLQTETAETLRVADGVYASLDALVDGLQGIASRLAGHETATGTAAVIGTTARSGSSPAKVVGAVACLVVGLASGGVGGYFAWDGAVNGKAAIDGANSTYESAGAADAPAAWDALMAATASSKSKLYWGIGLAGGGALLTAVGLIIAAAPGPRAAEAASVSMLLQPGERATLLGFAIRY